MSPEVIAVLILFVARVAIPLMVLFILGALLAQRSQRIGR